MSTLSICPACSAHIRAVEVTCPFCDVPGPTRAGKLAVAAATVLSVLSVAACGYGLPPKTTTPDAAVDAHGVDAPHADAH